MIRVHKFKLLPLSPIHIGGRFQALFPFDYIIHDGKLFVIREGELGKFLQEKGLLPDFLKGFEQPGFSLTNYLSHKGLLSPPLIERIALYSCELVCHLPAGRQMRPFTRDAYQRPFIPGTAIKGAMRTSLWYDAVVRNSDLLWKVRSALKEERKKAKEMDNELDKDIFEDYRLENKQRSPNTDILRVIKVSDAEPWERDSLCVGEEETLARGKPRPKISTYLEFVRKMQATKLNISFDESLFELFKRAGNPLFNSFEDFLSKVDAFYRKVAEAELQEGEKVSKGFYEWLLKDTKGKGYLLRIGWGGGLPSTTIWLALPEDLREDIRQHFFKRSHRERFPMTRRFLKRKEKERYTYTPFGWVLLQEVR